MKVPAVSTRWWRDAPQLAATSKSSAGAVRARYRLGAVVLEIDSTYSPLIDEFESAYGDCAVTSEPPDVVCRARVVDPLVALTFEVAAAIPDLCAIASTVTRPRAELQHFVVRPLEQAGWQFIANLQNEEEPLIAANARTALFNPRVEPWEFLLNFVVAVAQLAQEPVIFVHGGGLSISGRGVLIVGRSGQGKSTTTAAVAARGHALFGDETVGIHAETRQMLPFRRTMKVRPGPRSEWVAAALSRQPYNIRQDANGTDCAWVRPSEIFPNTAAPAATLLSDVFFLRRFSDAPSAHAFAPKLPDHLEDLQALTMSLSAVASWPFSPAHRALRFARIADVFSRCNCYFLDLGTPDDTAEAIERTVLKNADRA